MINPAILLGFVAMTHPPLDATYVFRVPVRIENMRHVTQAAVTCSITLEASGGLISVGTTGTDMRWIPVTDGALTDTVTISITVSSTMLATGRPVRWLCGLVYDFRLPDGTVYRRSTVPGEREATYTRTTGQDITTAVVEVGGELTPP